MALLASKRSYPPTLTQIHPLQGTPLIKCGSQAFVVTTPLLFISFNVSLPSLALLTMSKGKGFLPSLKI